MRRAVDDLIDRVRSICVALPDVKETGGTASGVGALSGTRVVHFKVSGRVVARVSVLDPGGRETVVLSLRATPEERHALERSGHPFIRAGRGSPDLSLVLDADTDWTEVAELVTESYLIGAPAKLAAEVEASLRIGDAGEPDLRRRGPASPSS